MKKTIWSIAITSVVFGITAQTRSALEQKKQQLEQDLLVLQQNLKDIRIELTRLTAAAAELKPVLEEDALKAIKEAISHNIDALALQFDPDRPESNILKGLLEWISWGRYHRPTGNLTPEAFSTLYRWLEDLSDRELSYALVLVNEKIATHKVNESPASCSKDEQGHFKALHIIKDEIRFAQDKRKED